MKRNVFRATIRAWFVLLLAGQGGVAEAQHFTLRQAPQDALDLVVRRDLQGADLVGRDGPLAKVGHDLARLYRVHQAFRRAGAAGVFQPRDTGLPVRGDHVVIDAASEDPGMLRAELEALGLVNGATYGRMVSGRLPIAAIARAAALPGLRLARAARFHTHAGPVLSQGDSAMDTGVFRVLQGIDGTGITIGTLSDSYDCFTTNADPEIAAGELPGPANPFGYTTPMEILDDTACGTDEGRAMMQIIHDVAPGAAQSFHTAFNGQADFALGIEELAGCPPGSTPGCVPAATPADIIVDDVGYLDAPFFLDGVVAQAVDFVVGSGVPYFSSAGNQGRLSYEAPFEDSGMTIDIGGGPQRAHDFDPGAGVDIYQQVTIPRLRLVRFAFQWDEPFFSVSGGGGAQSDLDIVLLDDPPTTVLASSTIDNVGGDPTELFQYAHATTDTTFNIAILEWNPGQTQPDPGRLKYIVFGTSRIDDFPTHSATTFGHANAANAEAVGAAFYGATPPYGTTPPLVEGFSSAGGTPILRSSAGTPLGTPEVRVKPGISAPDGANTSFFGSDIPQDADAFPNFFGTSAAAPHAAAYAALLMELDPTFTPQALYAHMRNTAIDMDDPFTGGFDAGFDYGTGYGLITAMAPIVGLPRAATPGLVSAWSYPNPFRAATTIRFTLPQAGEARIRIYDTNGRRVRTLAEGRFASGAHELAWEGRDAGGKSLRSGVYFIRVESGGTVRTHRTVLMR